MVLSTLKHGVLVPSIPSFQNVFTSYYNTHTHCPQLLVSTIYYL